MEDFSIRINEILFLPELNDVLLHLSDPQGMKNLNKEFSKYAEHMSAAIEKVKNSSLSDVSFTEMEELVENRTNQLDIMKKKISEILSSNLEKVLDRQV